MKNFNYQIIKALEKNEIPWYRSWVGRLGPHKNIVTNEKYTGIDFLLLQMASNEYKFTSNLWGTNDQLTNIKPRPDYIIPGNWGTAIKDNIVYNLSQTENFAEILPKKVLYDKANDIFDNLPVSIVNEGMDYAYYYYPPNDYITIPEKEHFQNGLSGLIGYYESLAHELMHWSENKVGFDTIAPIAIRELRAEIGAAMLVEELCLPHSISRLNFDQYKFEWINLIKANLDLINDVANAASIGANYILRVHKNACF